MLFCRRKDPPAGTPSAGCEEKGVEKEETEKWAKEGPYELPEDKNMTSSNPIILCVDDEKKHLDLLETMLEGNGYQVVNASNGPDALQKINHQTIDLVLLDILMPGMDGFEVCRQIKEDPKLGDIPIIMITGLTSSKDHVRGIEVGVEDFFTKPIKKAELLARIKILLKVKKLGDERRRAEEALRKSYDELDDQVKLRTAELARANEMLQADIAERMLFERKLQLHSVIMANLAEGVYLIRASDAVILYANPRFEAMFGYDAGELIGKNVSIVNAPTEKSPEETAQEIIEYLHQNKVWSGEIKNIKKDGTTFWCDAKVTKFDHPDYGTVWVSVHSDITERKRAVEALQESQAKYYDLYDNAPDMYYSLDLSTGVIKECNKAFVRTTGYRKEELIGRPIFELYDANSANDAKEDLQNFPVAGEIRNAERKVRCKNGRIMDVSLNVSAIRSKDGTITHSRSLWRDITERKEYEAAIRALSITDPLTNLYNRRGFMTLAEQQLRIAERTKSCLLLLYADLDGLKQINDTLGHKSGDEALVETAHVLREVFRKMDIIARMGGDEFAVLAPEASLKHSDIIKNRLKDELNQRNAGKGHPFNISMSVGITDYEPAHPLSLDELISRADSLMYEQKRRKPPKTCQEGFGA